MRLVSISVLIMTLAVAGCGQPASGPQGPAGPGGAEGPQGPAGPPGAQGPQAQRVRAAHRVRKVPPGLRVRRESLGPRRRCAS
jgi:hypothetical protein